MFGSVLEGRKDSLLLKVSLDHASAQVTKLCSYRSINSFLRDVDLWLLSQTLALLNHRANFSRVQNFRRLFTFPKQYRLA